MNYLRRKQIEMELYWSHCGTTRVRTPDLLNKPAIKTLSDVKEFVKKLTRLISKL